MSGTLLKLTTWLLQKLLGALVILLLALAGYGLWLYVQDEEQMEAQRITHLQQTLALRERLLVAQTEMAERITRARTELAREQDRAQRAAEIVAALRQLESWWDRWFGNAAQQAANAEQMQRMEQLKSSATARLGELQREIAQLLGGKDELERQLQEADLAVARLEQGQTRPRHYVLAAWDATKLWVAVALATYFAGPTVWSLFMYFIVAGVLAHGRPIRLRAEAAVVPSVSESRVSISAPLAAGERLRIKEKFLQASDESIGRRTRFVLDWRIPFTSLACGLVELIELTPPADAGEGSWHVTLSNSDDPHLELAVVEVPAGASLILRPSFLAGVIQRRGERLQIRRHWRIFRWQAWIGGQFRFFEFVGPCRLVVAGSRGVRAERLETPPEQRPPARRTNQDATIAFTPNLDYRPVRAETFWSYYRGMNPLFDDLFSGRGLFILQETASPGDGARAARFWASVWNGLLKVFGL